MIASAEEFVELRRSERQEEYLRAAWESAPREVWLEVIQRFPDMRFWVAQNKTMPVEVLAVLARDPDPRVRSIVAMKNRLTNELFCTAGDRSGRFCACKGCTQQEGSTGDPEGPCIGSVRNCFGRGESKAQLKVGRLR